MLQLQSSVTPHFERNTAHLPDADNKFTGNTLDILQPQIATVLILILAVPKAVLPTRKVLLP